MWESRLKAEGRRGSLPATRSVLGHRHWGPFSIVLQPLGHLEKRSIFGYFSYMFAYMFPDR